MSNTKFSNFKSEDGNTGPDLVGITSFTSPYYFVPPSGTTAQRPSNAVPGQLRFNTDIGRLEVWRGDHWATILGESPNLNGGARGIFGGGYTNDLSPPGNNSNVIDYVTISSTGNAIDFGDLITRVVTPAACSSSTRGVWAGGENPGALNVIEFITISSTGNSQDFGDLFSQRFGVIGLSNQTRGIFAGGNNPAVNIIEYITITSTGQNTQDFGDLSASKRRMGAVSSSTRGVFGGGAPTTNVIEFITISTLGNSSDFGDLFSGSYSLSKGNISNSIRGIFGIGHNTSGYNNIIEFITIATTGNATDFGDLTTALGCERASTSSTVRGVFAGGGPSAAGSSINIIDFVTIMSTGNAVDFGDLTQKRQMLAGCSNGHGGL
jgi:hypothetical protein